VLSLGRYPSLGNVEAPGESYGTSRSCSHRNKVVDQSTSRIEVRRVSTSQLSWYIHGQAAAQEQDTQEYHRMLKKLSVKSEEKLEKNILLVRSSSFMSSLQSPKSHNAMWPE
jgi:hypothetical protein